MQNRVGKVKEASVSQLAETTHKSVNYTSNILSKLSQCKLVNVQKRGRSRYYMPELDATIAYAELD